jgi:hypothetical protein
MKEDYCDDCNTIFHNNKSFLLHKEKVKYCQQYKNVLFTCLQCSFSTKGIKNIDNHSNICTMDSSIQEKNPLLYLKQRVSELEQEITYNQSVYLSQLRLEHLKNKIYRHLIEQNTSIKIDDVVIEKEDGLHLYNVPNTISVFIHGVSQMDEKINIIEDNIKKNNRSRDRETDTTELLDSKKHSYRSIKACMLDFPKRNEYTEKDIEDKIRSVQLETQKQLESFGDLEKTQKSFPDYFEKLKQNRVYTKILDDLSKIRMNIFCRMNLSDYQKMVREHIEIIEDIFCQKKYTDKKSTMIIAKGLSSLESRLVSYGNYTESHLDVDEIQKLDIVLTVHKTDSKEYSVYNPNLFFNCFYNYGSVLFSLKKNIERYLFNSYGFFNVIYLPLPKNTTIDPYSFYILDRISKEKRYWKMDCRLEELSISLSENVIPYMINSFRKLYKDVFGDNDFRKDFSNKCQITECDCEQLLQNIILLGQPKELCNMMRKMVKDKATYTPTEKDKFNLYGDDSLQRKKFHDKEDVDLVYIIKELFDHITIEEAVDFYRNRII